MKIEDETLEQLEFAPRKNLPSGIGGWLILPLIGLFLTPLVVLGATVKDIIPVFEPSTWAALTHPDGLAYHPHWATYIYGSIIINAIVGLGAVILIPIAFMKKSFFPMLMIGFYAISLLATLLDLYGITTVVAESMPSELATARADALKAFTRSLFTCLIWIPYFVTSKRVRNTFTE